MKKIKILYGLEAAGGGALKHLVYLVTRLDKSYFDITVILSSSRSENISEELDKMKEANVNVMMWPMSKSISPIRDLYTIFRITLFIQKHKFDIIHAHSSKAGCLFRLAAYLCRTPNIYYTPHCFYFQGKSGIKKRFFILIEKFLGKLTSDIIVSENEQKEIIKHQVVIPSKVKNINNAIDFNEYNQSKEVHKTKAFYNIKTNSFVVGSIGRLVPQKDWNTFVYAAKKVTETYSETVFLIIGDGELYEEIQKLILKLKLEDRIILTGYVQKIHKMYGIIDIFVNTSLWEGLPYVFLEAMRYQKPIIATSTGNNTTIIDEESGFISPVKDYLYIAKKIIKLIENRQLAVEMGEKGKEWLTQKYSFKLFIQKHEELYKGISFKKNKQYIFI